MATDMHQAVDRAVGPRAPLPSLLDPAGLADYLGIPLATIYRWRARQSGPPGLKVGKHVRYRLADVDRWLDQQGDPRRSA